MSSRRPARLRMLVSVALLLWGTVVVVSSLSSAAAHVDDGHSIDHVSGTWMALAAYANDGTLYPPLYDGQSFGGTRFMPIPILLQAGAARVTGEYVSSAKTLSYLLAASLTLFTFILLRRRGCPLSLAVMLATTLLVSGTGLVATMSVRNDALPVILQLCAIALVGRGYGRNAAVIAGALCALALLSKLSAVWAPLAIGLWLLSQKRRRLVEFAASLAIVVLASLAVLHVLGDGRMAENLFALSSGGIDRGPLARLELIAKQGFGWLFILPLSAAAGAAILVVRNRRFSLLHLAFACGLGVTGLVLLDPGAFVNHLLDVQVLSVLVVGDVLRRALASRGAIAIAACAAAAAILGAAALELRDNLPVVADARLLVRGGVDGDDRLPRLGRAIRHDATVLSEDPFVEVSRGRHPTVLDPFMLRRIVEEHPAWRRQLVARINNGYFDNVVLLYPPESAREWYRGVHFGAAVVGAIQARYRAARRVGGLWIYVPKGRRSRPRV